MRAILLSACLVLGASSLAQARPDSLTMSCAATRGLVQKSGAVVIGTGPNIYERFVTQRRFCTMTQVTEPAWIRTADQSQCLVGYRCVERPIKIRRM